MYLVFNFNILSQHNMQQIHQGYQVCSYANVHYCYWIVTHIKRTLHDRGRWKRGSGKRVIWWTLLRTGVLFVLHSGLFL